MQIEINVHELSLLIKGKLNHLSDNCQSMIGMVSTDHIIREMKRIGELSSLLNDERCKENLARGLEKQYMSPVKNTDWMKRNG